MGPCICSRQLLDKVSLMTTMLGSGLSTSHYLHLNWAGLHVPVTPRMVGREAGKSWELMASHSHPKKHALGSVRDLVLRQWNREKNRGRHLMSYLSLHICIHLHTTHTHSLKTLLESIPPKSLNINSTFRHKKYKLYHNHHQLWKKKGKYWHVVVANPLYSSC